MNLFDALGFPSKKYAPSIEHVSHWHSGALGRNVQFDIYLPPGYHQRSDVTYPLLLINDGQDLPRMDFKKILKHMNKGRAIPHLIVVGIYAGDERIREYGTLRQADYKGRGDKAPQYKSFIMNELLPFLRGRLAISDHPGEIVFAGFSLGGLSALDIAWSEPEVFGGAGIFSGALWWRWEDVNPEDPDGGRIMHDIILNSDAAPHGNQYFWFMAGTGDEDEDRNNNGVIDAIDDTVHCLESMITIGLEEEQTRYFEVQDGTHDPQTWGVAMPDFLDWMFSEVGGGQE